MNDKEIIETTKAGSKKRQYLLAKNVLKKPTKTFHDFYFLQDTFKMLVDTADELILFEIDDM